MSAEPPAEVPTRTRVHVGELISLISALVLLVLMFAFAWYGVAGVPDPSAARPALSSSEDAWTALSDIRWILLATVVAVLGSVVLHATQRRHGARTDTAPVIAGLGLLSSVALAWRVLITLPGSGRVIDQKLGAVLGLVAVLGIAWGGLEAIRDERARRVRRGHRPHEDGVTAGPTPGDGPA